jgi:hypothetical protein
VINDHDPRIRLADALGLANQDVRIADHRDHVADEDVVERVVAERKLQRVGLEDADIVQVILADFLARLAEHAGRKVDADHPAAVARVERQRRARADPQVQDQVAGGDVHVVDGAFDAAFDQPAERGVVEYRVNIVNLAGAGFLHGERLFSADS